MGLIFDKSYPFAHTYSSNLAQYDLDQSDIHRWLKATRFIPVAYYQSIFGHLIDNNIHLIKLILVVIIIIIDALTHFSGASFASFAFPVNHIQCHVLISNFTIRHHD